MAIQKLRRKDSVRDASTMGSTSHTHRGGWAPESAAAPAKHVKKSMMMFAGAS